MSEGQELRSEENKNRYVPNYVQISDKCGINADC